jgi:hypothetical protein
MLGNFDELVERQSLDRVPGGPPIDMMRGISLAQGVTN